MPEENAQVRRRRERYRQQLLDPRWQKKRLEIMQRDNWTCQACGDTTTTLNVHHLNYRPKADPWDYEPYSLLTLCIMCHERETQQTQVIRYEIDDKLTWPWDSHALGQLASFLDALCFEYLPWNWSEEDMRASIRKRALALHWLQDVGLTLLRQHWKEAQAAYEEIEWGYFVEPEDLPEVLKYHQKRKGI